MCLIGSFLQHLAPLGKCLMMLEPVLVRLKEKKKSYQQIKKQPNNVIC